MPDLPERILPDKGDEDVLPPSSASADPLTPLHDQVSLTIPHLHHRSPGLVALLISADDPASLREDELSRWHSKMFL
jgi:hypothetical protein